MCESAADRVAHRRPPRGPGDEERRLGARSEGRRRQGRQGIFICRFRECPPARVRDWRGGGADVAMINAKRFDPRDGVDEGRFQHNWYEIRVEGWRTQDAEYHRHHVFAMLRLNRFRHSAGAQ